MTVYCSHLNKTFTKGSNYYHCHFCGYGWYGTNPIPLVVIGQTDPIDVNPNYLDAIHGKDLTKKKFNRCPVCRDLLEKRKHRLCNVKSNFKILKVRHAEFIETVIKVVKGFRKDI